MSTPDTGLRPFARKSLLITAVSVLLAATIVTLVLALRPNTPTASSVDPGAVKAFAAAAEKHDEDQKRKIQAARTELVAFPASRPLRLLVIGDSISDGAYTTSAGKQYRSILKAALARHGDVEMTTVAVPGSTTGGMLSRVPGQSYDLIVTELGTNDVQKTRVADFTRNYRALLKSLLTESPQAGLVCLGPWGTPAATEQSSAVVKQLCEQNKGQFRDLATFYINGKNRWVDEVMPNGRKVDNFHPNDRGHSLIAEAALDALRFD